jgi:hypothetical protein
MFIEYMNAVLAGAMFACMGWGAPRIRLATTYNNGSVWMAPGTVSADD